MTAGRLQSISTDVIDALLRIGLVLKYCRDCLDWACSDLVKFEVKRYIRVHGAVVYVINVCSWVKRASQGGSFL